MPNGTYGVVRGVGVNLSSYSIYPKGYVISQIVTQFGFISSFLSAIYGKIRHRFRERINRILLLM